MNISDAIIVAVISALPPTIVGIANFIIGLRNGRTASERGHRLENTLSVVAKQTDGLTKELVKVNRSDAEQVGHTAGVAAEKADQLARDSQFITDEDIMKASNPAKVPAKPQPTGPKPASDSPRPKVPPK